jgi:trans-aconitate 2-methyltransferase
VAWDPKTYLAYGTERTRPVGELLARVPANTPKRVVDLGCGPGNSTAALAARWPEADIEGVDSSAEMLDEARRSRVRARWTLADISTWGPREKFDVIFSNATFHWIPDHRALLPRLLSFVTNGGTIAFQMPQNFSEPCHALMHEIAAYGPWAAKIAHVRDMAGVLEPEAYFAILEPHCVQTDIWETRYAQTLVGEDAVYRWMTGTALRPYANALEGEEREAFLAEYRRRVGKVYPQRESGVTLFPFRRLFCVGRTK